MSVEELEREINPHGFPHFEAVAPRGEGVFPTLKDLAGRVLETVNKGGLATTRSQSAPAAPGRGQGARATAQPDPSAPAPRTRQPAMAGAAAPAADPGGRAGPRRRHARTVRWRPLRRRPRLTRLRRPLRDAPSAARTSHDAAHRPRRRPTTARRRAATSRCRIAW